MNTPGVLLLSPGIVKWDDQDFGLPHLVSLGGYLRAHTGVRVQILDVGYEGGDRRSLERTIRELGPWLLIGVATYSSFDYRRSIALGAWLRSLYPEVPLVTGGYHASARPFDCTGDGLPFDAVLVGEAEELLLGIVRTLLGGGRLDQRVYGPAVVADLDALPPYAWDLLARYWPHARSLGRKLQVYLSRGCVYHCDFCMERAKSGYSWRAYSPERAVDELARLATFTDLSGWVVNLADPLFGFQRRWRLAVLEGIVARGLAPRQYWTLTRSDDLDDDDVELLARARFAIGIGLESGSPSMLTRMGKTGGGPAAMGRYLNAVRRLARLAEGAGLNWAANVIVGHPGETVAEREETLGFVNELFLTRPTTRGWLSVDPFRLYPGSAIAESIDQVEAEHGARFHHPTWWKSWYDASFKAEHLDASREIDFRDRVRFLFDAYAPVARAIRDRFTGSGRDVDAVYRASIDGVVRYLTPENRDALLARADAADRALAAGRDRAPRPDLTVPIGLAIRDPWVRLREGAVRRLLDSGLLRTEALIDALLRVGPERWMPEEHARAILGGRTPEVPEGELPWGLAIDLVAIGLEALGPDDGQHAVDATARVGWLAAVLAELVGADGRVTAIGRGEGPNVVARAGDAALVTTLDADRVWFGAALPRRPPLRLGPGGRAVALIGPRFRPQDLVVWTATDERTLATARVPVLGGPLGWVPARSSVGPSAVAAEVWPAAVVLYQALARVDARPDAASLYDPALGADPELTAAYLAAPGRLAVHGLGLLHRDRHQLEVALASPPEPLADAAGRSLCELLVARVRALPETRAEPPDAARVERLAEGLRPLRSRLWSGNPPPLRVLDVPALGRHARGGTVGGERRVAVSFARDDDDLLLQVLHEEVHPVTDPHVPDGPRDTRPGEPGWERHRALEQTALAATEAILELDAPHRLPAFRRWLAETG